MPRTAVCQGVPWAIDKDSRLRYHFGGSWHTPPKYGVPTTLAACPRFVYAGTSTGSVAVYSSDGRLITSAEACEDAVSALCASNDDNALFVGSAAGAMVRISLDSLQVQAELDEAGGQGHASRVEALALAGEFLFSGGADAAIYVWAVDSNQCCREIVMTQQPITALCFDGKYLWVGEADGVVRVLDVYGEEGDGITCVAEKKVHDAPVRALLHAGDRVFSATGTSDRIAAWNANNFAALRDHHLPTNANGVLGLFVREREVTQRFSIAALDHNLQRSDFNFECYSPGIADAVNNTPNYQGVLIATMDSELKRLKEQLRNYRQNDARMNNFSNGDPANLDSNRTVTNHESTTGVVGELTSALVDAKEALSNALDRSVVEWGGPESVAAEGVIKALNLVSGAANLAGRMERGSVSDSETPSRSYGESCTGFYPETGGDPKEFEALMAEKETLREDVISLQKSLASEKEVTDTWKKWCKDLEEKLEVARTEALEAELAKRRLDELQCLTKHQVQTIARSVETLEPRLNSHVQDAYNHMASDRDELKRLQAENQALIQELEQERSRRSLVEIESEALRNEQERRRDDDSTNLELIRSLKDIATKHDEEHELVLKSNRKFADATNTLERELAAAREEIQTLRLAEQSEHDSSKHAQRLEVRNKTLAIELEQAREALATVKSAAQDAQRKLEEKEFELTSAITSNKELNRLAEEAVQEARGELANARSEIAKLASTSTPPAPTSDAIALAEQAHEETKKELATVLRENSRLSRTATDASEDLRALRAQVEAMDTASATEGDTNPTSPAHTIVKSSWSIIGSRDDRELRAALEAAAESTRCTQEVVKELAATADAYKKAARYHAQSQAAVVAVLKRMRSLAKRKNIQAEQLKPVVDALMQAVYIQHQPSTTP